jgi:hypothetical protein
MKRKGIAILCIVLSWFAVRAQDSNAKKPANNFKSSDQLASVAKSRTSVVFNGKAKLQVDSPSSIQVFYFSDSSSSETKDNRDADYYSKRANSERKRGIVFSAIGYPMIGGGACLLTLGIMQAIRQEGIDGDSPSATVALMSAIINGAGLLATGIPLAIKGPICLAEAKRYQKKAAALQTTYKLEPAILMVNNKAIGGLYFRLSF